MTITLPDGKAMTFARGVTGADVAAAIGPGLAKAALAVEVDGQQWDLSRSIERDARLRILTRKDPEALELIRHDAAHVLAMAVQALYPGTQVTIGPAIEDGFYYDFARAEPFTPEDLPKIEAKMHEIVKAALPTRREVWPRDQAIAHFEGLGESYKAELIRAIPEGEDVSIYFHGDWHDLCRGPHFATTAPIGDAFKLTKIAGAYWRGDAKNAQLQRIYGTAWRDKKELDEHLIRLEEAERRDHRKLGKELELFTFSPDVGAGLPLWMPNGMVIRQELEFLALQEERKDGYFRVATPHITKEALYYRSRHLPYYADSMYSPLDIDGENYYLRPMNCPHHHLIYNATRHSYRELPLRIAEYGQDYRYEASGGLSGLMRVRGFCMNDAHIYCRTDQAKDEFIRVMRLHARYYDLMDIKDYYMRLSLPDLDKLDKYVDQPEKWLTALDIIKQAMKESGYPYVEGKGEAAFYGPKIDFMIKSAIGTEYTISTNQLDFLATQTFELSYIGEDGADHPVYVIHRAPLGTHERFTAFLIEHYAGAFPVWLAPIQARVIPITEKVADYALEVKDRLFREPVVNGTGGLRVDIDLASERMQKKIRDAQLKKIPYMLVVGEREAAEGKVAVRLRSGKDLGAMPLEAFVARIKAEAESRRDVAD
ncbi:MAG: threonine--tRNA ligase [Alphaproteobacteria bacterium]|nr:threonine--tRNA ligase [Alphaproteobacteria bacterium]MDE2014072.1 threonine--tRNA ligase [Alphaproteobacteria bacterium]MDE2073092.1 threonine--tRNA ligase [Alphaproteobacteria bacterium]MDE2352107.1 threonine--tRNA ligase [Alphaproteobacteria bacterium]